jgi:hypothetical protein
MINRWRGVKPSAPSGPSGRDTIWAPDSGVFESFLAMIYQAFRSKFVISMGFLRFSSFSYGSCYAHIRTLLEDIQTFVRIKLAKCRTWGVEIEHTFD